MKNGNLWPNVPAGLHALQLIRGYTLHKHAARARCNRSPEEPLRCAPVAGTARRAGFWRRSAAPRYRAPSLTIHAGAARCTGLQAAAFTYLQAYAQVSKGWCGLDRSAYPRLCGRCSQEQPESRVWSGGWKVLAGPLARQMLRTRVPREWAAIPVLYQPSGRRSHHMAEWPSGPRRTWERGGRWWGR
mgnify:CR=1 FL=1